MVPIHFVAKRGLPRLRASSFSQNTDVRGMEEPGLFNAADMKTDVGATREV